VKYGIYKTCPYSIEEILRTNGNDFFTKALRLFQFQYQNNTVYNRWTDMVKTTVENISSITTIPFLPISFFKTHQVTTTVFQPEIIFTSSGTTKDATSQHFVAYKQWYEQSFTAAFKLFYGNPTDCAIIGLLPSYLERTGSSLVYMTEQLITQSKDVDSGLYLYDFEKLSQLLLQRETAGKQTWLIGVTYALIDFAERFPMPLKHTTLVETGGMKGKKKELTRPEVQGFLKNAFAVEHVHSEYGMTELLSQAYAKTDGIFTCPPWMKVLVRDEDDPLAIHETGAGALCIIDLANAYSCSFIATDDIGKVYPDGSFEVLGRLDNSDIRGCSLLAL
jgi:hypothetical protein